MTHRYLVDTGPLVALLNRREQHHAWACKVFGAIAPPLYTCESVISEACFVVRQLEGGRDAVLRLVDDGIVRVAFSLTDEVSAVRTLMKRYASIPMSLADACLVRMAELHDDATLITADQDFSVYRRHKRQHIAQLSPNARAAR